MAEKNISLIVKWLNTGVITSEMRCVRTNVIYLLLGCACARSTWGLHEVWLVQGLHEAYRTFDLPPTMQGLHEVWLVHARFTWGLQDICPINTTNLCTVFTPQPPTVYQELHILAILGVVLVWVVNDYTLFVRYLTPVLQWTNMSRHPDKRTNVGHNFNYMCTLNITDDNNNKQIVPQPSKLPGRPRSFHTLSHASVVPSSSPLPSESPSSRDEIPSSFQAIAAQLGAGANFPKSQTLKVIKTVNWERWIIKAGLAWLRYSSLIFPYGLNTRLEIPCLTHSYASLIT